MPDQSRAWFTVSAEPRGAGMAHLLANFKAQYPYINEIVSDLHLMEIRKRRVFQAYCKWSGLTPDLGRTAMRTDVSLMRNGQRVGPDIEVISGRYIRGYAHYPSSGPLIQINKIFADQFEALMKCDPMRGFDPHGRYLEERPAGVLLDEQNNARLLMQSKILHEMVHWGRTMISFLPDPRHPDYGWNFEVAAYGKQLYSTTLGLRAYINIPGNQ